MSNDSRRRLPWDFLADLKRKTAEGAKQKLNALNTEAEEGQKRSGERSWWNKL